MRVGDPKADGIDIGPLIERDHLEKVRSYVELGQAEGGELLAGGAAVERDGLSTGLHFPATVLGGMRNDMRTVREEIFGPVQVIIPFDDERDALRIVNHRVRAGGDAVDVERRPRQRDGARVARRDAVGQLVLRPRPARAVRRRRRQRHRPRGRLLLARVLHRAARRRDQAPRDPVMPLITIRLALERVGVHLFELEPDHVARGGRLVSDDAV